MVQKSERCILEIQCPLPLVECFFTELSQKKKRGHLDKIYRLVSIFPVLISRVPVLIAKGSAHYILWQGNHFSSLLLAASLYPGCCYKHPSADTPCLVPGNCSFGRFLLLVLLSLKD